MEFNNDIYFSGTSGLLLPVPQALYPPEFRDKSRLAYYGSLFNSVEINSSFYKMPKSSTVAKWVESVGDNFQFTFKLSKAITHVKGLKFNDEDVYNFFETIAPASNKKGCLLLQFPPGLKFEKIDQLQRLLVTINGANNHQWKIAVEFRNPSWYQRELYELLDEFKATVVIHDLPASATPIMPSTAGFRYLRFHGPESRYRGSYTDEFLFSYAQNIKAWLSGGEVYCYFNNTMGAALKNLQTLNSFLHQ